MAKPTKRFLKHNKMYCSRCRKMQPIIRENWIPYGSDDVHSDYICAICNSILRQDKFSSKVFNREDEEI